MFQSRFELLGGFFLTPDPPQQAGISASPLRIDRVLFNLLAQARERRLVAGQRLLYFLQTLKDVGQSFRFNILGRSLQRLVVIVVCPP
jgi:hypothetical protein